jgi:hypothetical protein
MEVAILLSVLAIGAVNIVGLLVMKQRHQQTLSDISAVLEKLRDESAAAPPISKVASSSVTSAPSTSGSTVDEERKLLWEVKSKEYEIAATRYDNIYRAVWQQFSFLATGSALAVAFGSKTFHLVPLALIVAIPLLFWWFAQFWPLDKYGDNARDRLKDIEREINQTVLNVGDSSKEAIKHFGGFRDFAKTQPMMRVTHRVNLAFFALLFLWIIGLGMWLTGNKGPVPSEQKVTSSDTVNIRVVPHPRPDQLGADSLYRHLTDEFRTLKTRVDTLCAARGC